MTRIKLGDAATFINGKAFKPSEWTTKGKKIIRIQNLTNVNNPFNYFDGEVEEKYIVRKGDILISWSASIGVYEWEYDESVLNQHIFKVVFDKYEFDKDYFKYLMESKIRVMLSKVHGSTMKHITKKDFDKIEIDYIDISEQKKVAKELNKIRKLIRLKQQDVLDYDLLINSKLDNSYKEELEYVKIEEIATFINGDRSTNYPSSSEIQKNGEIPFINAGLINKDKLDWENMNYISNKTYDRLSSGKIQKDDILYCLRGSLGKHGYIKDDVKGAIASSLVIIRANKDLIEPKFLYFILDSDDVLLQLERVKNGSTQPNLSSSSVKNFKIKYPSLKSQKKFIKFVEEIENQKEICDCDICDLTSIL